MGADVGYVDIRLQSRLEDGLALLGFDLLAVNDDFVSHRNHLDKEMNCERAWIAQGHNLFGDPDTSNG